jgi:hypothetical protein
MRHDNQWRATAVSPVSARTDRATDRRRTDMTSRTRTASIAAASLAGLAGLTALVGVSGLTDPATSATATATARTETTHATSTSTRPHTRLTLAVTGCDGCRLRLVQAIDGRPGVWQSGGRTVRHGSVAWTVPTSRTHGLSITVLAPWDGGAGYVPTVAFRYAGEHVGDRVTDAVAATERRVSACWAGTASSTARIAVTVVHARSTNPPGHPIRTPRAFTTVTQPWDGPMYRVWHGMSGTQDATYCR